MPNNRNNGRVAAAMAAEEPRQEAAFEPLEVDRPLEDQVQPLGRFVFRNDNFRNANIEEQLDPEIQEVLSKINEELGIKDKNENESIENESVDKGKLGKTVSAIFESRKVDISYINNYIIRKLNFNDDENYSLFQQRMGYKLTKLSNCIILVNCAIAKFDNKSKNWSNVCSLFKIVNRVLEFVRCNSSRDFSYLPQLCRTADEAREWAPKNAKAIYNLIEEYKEQFGIIKLEDNSEFLGSDTLYPGEHLYYIAHIDQYWGKYLHSDIQIGQLFDVIQETCPNFVHMLAQPVFIIEDSEVEALKKLATEFIEIKDFKAKYKDLKVVNNK